MVKLKRKKAHLTRFFAEFGGLRDDADTSERGAVSIRNFRFRSDKTLERRPGYRLLRAFDRSIRAFWQGTIGTYTGYFVLFGNDILYFESGRTPVSFGRVSEASGAAKFFVYQDRLYLCDSSNIYVCDFAEECFRESCGYAPLYGRNFSPSTGSGEINEPLNLFSDRVRIQYGCPAGTTRIVLPFYARRIDACYINGSPSSNYSFAIGSNFVIIPALQADAVVELAVTLTSGHTPMRPFIASATIAYALQKNDREYLYLAGGLAEYKAYSAARVTSLMLAESSIPYPDSDPLYFKATGVLNMGDASHPLTGFVRQNNRVIAFGTSGAWSIYRGDDGDTVEAYLLESCPGCVSRNGVISVGDEIMVLTPSGLCSLKASATDKDHFSVTPLCAEISRILGGFQWSRAILFHDFRKNQIWIRDTGETTEGLVYLYDRSLDLWTAWNHIHAGTIASSSDGEILFSKDDKLYIFDESLYTDDGQAYTAFYQSGAIPMGAPEEWKRSMRAFCEVTPQRGQSFSMHILADRAAVSNLWECAEERNFPMHCELRMSGARFRYFYYILEITEPGPFTVHRLGFHCNL